MWRLITVNVGKIRHQPPVTSFCIFDCHFANPASNMVVFISLVEGNEEVAFNRNSLGRDENISNQVQDSQELNESIISITCEFCLNSYII